MRREDYAVTVDGVAWLENDSSPRQPGITVSYSGDPDRVREQLIGPDGDPLSADQVDVSFRLLGGVDEPDVPGVLAISGRLTGDFILEANTDAETLLQFVRMARRYGETEHDPTGLYTVAIEAGDEELGLYEKRTLLVYNEAGDLLRERSLIPGGVEL